MDKREFYRQLMETYTIDTEKVKCNAKRRSVKSKTPNIQKWTAAAAACAAVTAAGFIIVSLNSLPQDSGIDPHSSGIDITDDNIESAMERMRKAEKRYEEINLTKADEELELYISLSKPLSRSEITMAFSAIEDYNDIVIALLYTSVGSCYQNTDNIGEGFSFSGVKVIAPSSLLSDIKMLKTVAYVEFAEDVTEGSFVPIDPSPEQYTTTLEPLSTPVQIIVPDSSTNTTLPPATSGTTATDPVTSDTSDTDTTPDTTDETDVISEQTEDSSSSEDTEPPVTAETTDTDTSEDTSTPEETTPDETTPEETTETETTPPRGNYAVEIPLADIKTINFISDTHLVATTADSIRLYSFTTESAKLETTFYASGAKITASGTDGTKLFITACDGEERKRLYYADGDIGLLCEIDVSYIAGGGTELSSVSCNEDATVILIKTVSLEKSCIYYATRFDGAISLLNSKEYTKPVSVLSYSYNIIYTAVTDPEDSSVKIYAVDALNGKETELCAYTGTLKYTRNFAKNMAFITITNEEGEKNFLLSSTGALIPLETSDIIFSDSNKNLVYIDKVGYTVEGSKLRETGKTYTGSTVVNRFANYSYLLEKEKSYIIIKNR